MIFRLRVYTPEGNWLPAFSGDTSGEAIAKAAKRYTTATAIKVLATLDSVIDDWGHDYDAEDD